MKNRNKWNLLTGLAYQVINTGMGLVLPYLFITGFGSETNGFLSSVMQLFVYLSLLEAGVGGASTQALYAPLVQEDRAGINAILSATARYCRRTGVLYGVGVLLIAFGYPVVVSSTLSKSTIISVILLHGAGNVVNYIVQARYLPLLKAEGKFYIINLLGLLTSILRNAGKIIAIAMGYGVVMVQFVHMLLTIINTLAVVWYMHRTYSWLDLRVPPNEKALSQKNSVLLQTIAWVVFNNIDVVILTVVARDLRLVSVYSVYLLVFEGVQNLADIVCNGLQHNLGQSWQKSRSEFATYYRRYEQRYLMVVFALFTITLLLVRSFVSLYVGDVKDANYLMPWLPELFFVVKILHSIRLVNRKAIEAVGHFEQTQSIFYWEITLNLGLSLMMARSFGIYGVLLGTVVSLLYSDIVHIYYTQTCLLQTGVAGEYKNLLSYSIVAGILSGVGRNILSECHSFLNLILQAIVVFVVVCSVFLMVEIILEKRVKGIAGEKV